VALGTGGATVATTDHRNHVVDLVRVAALAGVVLGHWLKQGWYVDEGVLHRIDLLRIAPWTHPLTWVFQVIPLFFLVGGFVNAQSWRHAEARGTGYGAWLAQRVGRLTRPLVPLLVLWCALVPVALSVGLDHDWLRVASTSALGPTWFLATYVVIVALVPLTVRAWERWGAWTLVPGCVALAVDVLSLRLGSTAVGGLNLLLVWGTVHQLGYGWRDGTLRTRRRAAALLLVGLGGALALVALGPYGPSMVGVGGYGVNNANPPRVTLLLLGLAWAGLVLLAEPALGRLSRRRAVRAVVASVGPRTMTLYLWHPTVMGILAAGSLWLGGVGLHPRPGTVEWWGLRPPWLLLLTLTLVVCVAVVGRFEDPVPTPTALPPTLPLAEVLVTAVLLGLLADRGLGAPGGVLSTWLLLLAGVTALITLDRLVRGRGRS
jgi:surface polysaccharide O-acyltransferase-like enzyme